jgi:cysteine synthase
MIARSAIDLVGRTPLVDLSLLSPNPKVRVLAKLEWFNPGGSVKDRAARQMVLDAIERGDLRPGMRVLEATSGNTGTALAFVARVLGFGLTLFIPQVTSARKREDMLRFGAELRVVEGETTERALDEAYALAAAEPELYYHTDQYTNRSNLRAHYLTTSVEILEHCPEITHFVAAQGSFGTLGGTGQRLREERPDVQIHAVVAKPGTTTLFGMKEEDRVMPLVDDSILSGRMLVSGHDAHDGIQAGFAAGFLLGPSAGGVMASMLRLARKLDSGTIVGVFADGGQKYPGCELYAANARSYLTAEQADAEAFSRW